MITAKHSIAKPGACWKTRGFSTYEQFSRTAAMFSRFIFTDLAWWHFQKTEEVCRSLITMFCSVPALHFVKQIPCEMMCLRNSLRLDGNLMGNVTPCRHFADNISNLGIKMYELCLRCHLNLFIRCELTISSIGLDNSLVPTRQHAIVWTNDG